jgi:DNA-binding SARP family transcriptional activator
MPTLHLHGAPLVVLDDGRSLPLAAREAALLAWLHLEGGTSRARLAGLLWPGGTEAQARANLRQTLARLRRAAGDLLDETEGVLRLAPMLDIAAALPVADAGAVLLGPLAFDDAPEFAAWLEARREAAQRDRLRTLLADGQAALSRHELDAALAAADAALALQPESEQAWRLRMEALHRRGDRAAALQAWDDCRHAVRAAFGVAPSAETQALGRRLLDEDPPPDAGRGAALGAAAPGALPAALHRPPRLVGRAAELQSLRQALALGHGALVLGPGGIGKSRLLAELAQAAGPALLTGARPGDAVQPGALLERLVAAALRRFEPVLDAGTRADLARLAPRALRVERGHHDERNGRSQSSGGDPSTSGRDGQRDGQHISQRDSPRADPTPPAAVRSALELRGLLGAVRRLLAACQPAGLRFVILDDLQFADEASLEALQSLVGAWRDAAPGTAPPPVLAARPDEAGAAARALLELLAASGRAARLELAPLEAASVRELLADLGLDAADPTAAPTQALADELHARVGGNPAFVLESLKALWLEAADAEGSGGAEAKDAGKDATKYAANESANAPADEPLTPARAAPLWSPGRALPVPPTLHEAVRRRLVRLSADALQLAQLAAVAESDFGLALAAAAFGRPPIALAPLLAELAAAQVFDGQVFAHDLVAEAVRQSLPPALSPALHGLVAEHLAAQLATDLAGSAARMSAAPARVAFHLDAAGQPAAAVAWHLRAGDAARARWQMAAAAASYEAAARALAVTSGSAGAAGTEAVRPRALRAWREAARCWQWASRYDDAARALDAAEALARDDDEQAPLAVQRANWLFNRHRFDEAVAATPPLVATLERAVSTMPLLDLAYGVRVAASTVPYGAAIGPALALLDCAQARFDAADAAAAPDGREAQRVFQVAAAGLRHWNAEPRPAAVALDAAHALACNAAGEADDPGALLLVLNQRMRVRHALGELDAAAADAEALLPLARRLEVGAMFVADVLHVRGMIEIARGHAAAGRRHLAAVAPTLAAAGLEVPETLRTSLALAAMNVGHLDEAVRWLGPAPQGRTALQQMAWQLTRARLALRRGEPAPVRLAAMAAARAAQGLSPALVLQLEAALASLEDFAADADASTMTLPGLRALHARVQSLGLRGMARTVALAAASASSVAGRHDEAVRWAHDALAVAACVDGWIDEPATVWHTAARVLAAAGAHDEAARVAAVGRDWVEAGRAQWTGTADAADDEIDAAADMAADKSGDASAAEAVDVVSNDVAWCERHPLHAALRSGTVQPVH